MLIRITAEGNNNAGKSTVLAILAEALKEKGFTNVKFVEPEQTEEMRHDKLLALPTHRPNFFDTNIELIEKYGTIER